MRLVLTEAAYTEGCWAVRTQGPRDTLGSVSHQNLSAFFGAVSKPLNPDNPAFNPQIENVWGRSARAPSHHEARQVMNKVAQLTMPRVSEHFEAFALKPVKPAVDFRSIRVFYDLDYQLSASANLAIPRIRFEIKSAIFDRQLSIEQGLRDLALEDYKAVIKALKPDKVGFTLALPEALDELSFWVNQPLFKSPSEIEPDTQESHHLSHTLDRLLEYSSHSQVQAIHHRLKGAKGSMIFMIQSLSVQEQNVLAKAVFRWGQYWGHVAPEGTRELMTFIGKKIGYKPTLAEQLTHLFPEDEGDYDKNRLSGAKKLLIMMEKGHDLPTILAHHVSLSLGELQKLRMMCAVEAEKSNLGMTDPIMGSFCKRLVQQFDEMLAYLNRQQKRKHQGVVADETIKQPTIYGESRQSEPVILEVEADGRIVNRKYTNKRRRNCARWRNTTRMKRCFVGFDSWPNPACGFDAVNQPLQNAAADGPSVV